MFSIPLARSQILNNVPPLRFPQKLWKIANECESGAVCWSPHGRSILLRYSLFKEEFMSTKNDFFKTDNISSFVRQLNLYGFRKVYDHTHKQVYKANPDLHEFSNIYFQRDRPDLLDKVTRKLGALKDKNDFPLENHHSSLEEAENLYDSKEKCSFGDENCGSSSRKEECSTQSKSVNFDDTSTIKTEPFVKIEDKIENIKIPDSEQTEKEADKTQNVKVADKAQNANVAANSQSIITTDIAQCVKEADRAQSTINSTLGNNNNILLEPVKKKRGRKPGSKSTKQKKRILPNSTKYPLPTLKYPEAFSSLLHFDYDDRSVFLRNTSRDVMLSSTLPFQETPEYLELKETYQTQKDLHPPRTSILYSSLPVSIPYIRYVNIVDYRNK